MSTTNRSTWKLILQLIVSIATAIATTLGVTSCMAMLWRSRRASITMPALFVVICLSIHNVRRTCAAWWAPKLINTVRRTCAAWWTPLKIYYVWRTCVAWWAPLLINNVRIINYQSSIINHHHCYLSYLLLFIEFDSAKVQTFSRIT